MQRFVAIEDDGQQMLLLSQGNAREESGEAREARVKEKYVEALGLFAAEDLVGALKGLTSVLDELEAKKKSKKEWESQLTYLARRNLAEIEEIRSNLEEALAHYRAALNEDDSDVVVWLRTGRCAAKLGKLNVARRAFEGGLIAQPNHILCSRELRKVLVALGEVQDDPSGSTLLGKRSRAELEGTAVDEKANPEAVKVLVDEPTWASLAGALSRALRIRLKQHKAVSVSARLVLKKGAAERSEDSKNDAEILDNTQSNFAWNAGAADRFLGKKTASNDIEGRRARVSQRQKDLERQREENRRELEQKREDKNIDVKRYLLELVPDQLQSSSRSLALTSAGRETESRDDTTCSMIRSAEVDEVCTFVQILQKDGGAGIVDILWRMLKAMSAPRNGDQQEAVRRVWKSLKPHYHRSILPPAQALVVAEALLPSNRHDEDGILHSMDSGDSENLKRLYDTEALLNSMSMQPVYILDGKHSPQVIATEARKAWVKAETSHFRGRIKEASNWYQQCDDLLLNLGEENAHLAFLGGIKSTMSYGDRRELVAQRLRTMESASSLEEARLMLENGQDEQMLKFLGPRVKQSVENHQEKDPQFLTEVQMLRVASENLGDNAGALFCRAMELKLAATDLIAIGKGEDKAAQDSTSLMVPVKKFSAKVKDLTTADAVTESVTTPGPSGRSFLEAAMLSVEVVPSVAAILVEDLRTKRASGKLVNNPTSHRQKKLSLSRCLLSFCRSLWFVFRWNPETTSKTAAEAGEKEELSLRLFRAVRFSLKQLASCSALRADGVSGAVIKFYTSLIRDRLRELDKEGEDRDRSQSGSESESPVEDESDREDAAIWNKVELCQEELACCYHALFDIPNMNGQGSNWLTDSCDHVAELGLDKPNSSSKNATDGATTKSKGGTGKDGHGDYGGSAANYLDPTTCGHILNFYRPNLVQAGRVNRDKNIKKVKDLLAVLSEALSSESFIDGIALLRAEEIEKLTGCSRSDDGATLQTLAQYLGKGVESTSKDGKSDEEIDEIRAHRSTVYEVKMLRAAAIMRITESEFKRRKEPERRSDLEEVLENLLEGARELKDAVRVRPWSVTAWRRFGYVNQDAGNVGLDLTSMLGKGRYSVVDPLTVLEQSANCFDIVAKLARLILAQKETTEGHEAESKEHDGHGSSKLDTEDEGSLVFIRSRLEAMLGSYEHDPSEPGKRVTPSRSIGLSMFLASANYERALSLYLIAAERRAKNQADQRQLLVEALACIEEAEPLSHVYSNLENLDALDNADFEDFSVLQHLKWFYKFLKGKLLLKLDRTSLPKALEEFAEAAKLQKEAEPLRERRKGVSVAPEVEATYRLLGSEMKALLNQSYLSNPDLLEFMERNLEVRKGVSVEEDEESRIKEIATVLISRLERCRSKEAQDHGEYFFKSVYYVALGSLKLLGDLPLALEKLSTLFRPDVGERGYFYLMWNYRFTDMRRATFLETERKYRRWRSKCLKLYIDLLSQSNDHGRLWNVFLRGRKRSKDDAFEHEVMFSVIAAYANSAVAEPEKSISNGAPAAMKRAWDAMDETTRLLHEHQQSSSVYREPFLAVKKMMELVYPQLDVAEDDQQEGSKPAPSVFKAAVRFCAKKWNTDQRIAKRALAVWAEYDQEATGNSPSKNRSDPADRNQTGETCKAALAGAAVENMVEVTTNQEEKAAKAPDDPNVVPTDELAKGESGNAAENGKGVAEDSPSIETDVKPVPEHDVVVLTDDDSVEMVPDNEVVRESRGGMRDSSLPIKPSSALESSG
ncbi:hypothetical protein NDN08_006504 [Rhodosorus marinus]|uniref:Uncharacterized protein n=1 Tax=Rhodosorus marinus TaxID=101924 RepID=A0AAV8UN64_9RHOD|nr:hypothetical protein NDN08_006504 [Rhodosorus marinus]